MRRPSRLLCKLLSFFLNSESAASNVSLLPSLSSSFEFEFEFLSRSSSRLTRMDNGARRVCSAMWMIAGRRNDVNRTERMSIL